jgi:hypothetical protein
MEHKYSYGLQSEDNPLNWNAGKEYNYIIQDNKIKFTTALLTDQFDACIDLLSSDLDFTYAKIIDEALKRKEDRSVLDKKIHVIKSKIKEARNFIFSQYATPTSSRYRKYSHNAREFIEDIREQLWVMQGTYGVLYPIIEIKVKDPRHAMKDGFK